MHCAGEVRAWGLPDLAQAAAEDAQARLAAAQGAAADGESRMLALEANLARHKAACAVRSRPVDPI